ncbi:thioredoxin domain-containing protein [Streptacidiphilus sp. P02-A3a]|uniref:DsbA family protein n=1 Tax=Streptacidiphilus sp. P02-A3a TaxID=2704468 RepID=UPI0015FB9BEA|nr:thioredoxin domain-containing protein [Streptacidiphilus sp. P02-A3a]QMU69494.1 thioredoxin domain-containing protein [Streptacidiphilus sp. P02-A3a]
MTPANTTGPEGTVLRYGPPDSGHLLTVYADLRCPYCKRLENGLGAVMQQVADAGRLALHHHFATFIDDMAGGSGSLRALAALGAAADEGDRTYLHYLRVLYAEQPREEDDAFADPGTLLRLAGEVPDLRGPEFDRKVTDGVHLPWARKVSAAFESSGVQGTPTVFYDGSPITVLNPMGYAVTPEAFLAQLAPVAD